MSVTKPDANAFDSADDSIASAREELHTLVTSFNTIADEYNAGTLGGSAGALLTLNRTNAPGSNGIITASATGNLDFDNIVDPDGFVTSTDSAGQGGSFLLDSGTYLFVCDIYYNISPISGTFLSNELEFSLAKGGSSFANRRHINDHESHATIVGSTTSTGTEEFTINYSWTKAGSPTLTFKEQGPANTDPVMKIQIYKIA